MLSGRARRATPVTVAGLLGLGVLLAILSSGGGKRLPGLDVTNPLTGRPKVALGVNLQGPSTAGAIAAFSHLVAIRPRVVMWFADWSEPLIDTAELQNVVSEGAIPMITWDPTVAGVGISLAAIAGGEYDRYIGAAARSAAAWHQPLYIRFAHEMNLPGSAFGPGHPGDSPATFVAAWRHVVAVFREQGATNVEWVWSPNTTCTGTCPFDSFYPGDAWVDSGRARRLQLLERPRRCLAFVRADIWALLRDSEPPNLKADDDWRDQLD